MMNVRLVVCAAAVAVLAGCAAPAHKENMVSAPVAATKKLPYTVNVSTRGGLETGLADSSNVSNADLKAAIESSIMSSQLFKQVVQGSVWPLLGWSRGTSGCRDQAHMPCAP